MSREWATTLRPFDESALPKRLRQLRDDWAEDYAVWNGMAGEYAQGRAEAIDLAIGSLCAAVFDMATEE